MAPTTLKEITGYCEQLKQYDSSRSSISLFGVIFQKTEIIDIFEVSKYEELD